MCRLHKAQVMTELLIFSATALAIMLIVIGVTLYSTGETKARQLQADALIIARYVQQELLVASGMPTGYTKILVLPTSLTSGSYTLIAHQNVLTVFFEDDSLETSIPRVGNAPVNFSQNSTISVTDGVIYVT